MLHLTICHGPITACDVSAQGEDRQFSVPTRSPRDLEPTTPVCERLHPSYVFKKTLIRPISSSLMSRLSRCNYVLVVVKLIELLDYAL